MVNGRYVDVKKQLLIDLLECNSEQEGTSQPLNEPAVWPTIVDIVSDEEATKFANLVEARSGIS